MVQIVIDSIVIVLLFVTIVYAFVLNKRLTMLNDSRDELKQFLDSFSDSLEQAKQGVDHLRKISHGSARELQDQISEARSIRDEINFFVKAGENAIDILDERLHDARELRRSRDTKTLPLNLDLNESENDLKIQRDQPKVENKVKTSPEELQAAIHKFSKKPPQPANQADKDKLLDALKGIR